MSLTIKRQRMLQGTLAGLTAQLDATTTARTVALGEWVYETDTGKVKIGDGASSYVALPYKTFSGGAPGLHAATHGIGGTDVLTPAAIGAATITVGETAPVAPTPGALWVTSDGTVATWFQDVYNPLTALPWVAAGWAENPGQTFADGAAVSSWSDGTGNSRHAVQATGGLQPIYRASGVNARPAVQFDGVDDFLASAAFTSLPQPYTLVVVARPTSVASGAIMALGTGATFIGVGLASSNYALGTGALLSGTAASAAAHLMVGFANGGSSTLRVDGTTVASGNAGATGIAAVKLGGGASASRPFTGYLAFWGLLPRALTTPEEASMRTWSQTLYGSA